MCSSDLQFVGRAYVNPATLISARILSRLPSQSIDARFFDERLRRAAALRERLYPRPYWRWVYGESDGLPGLVLDRYGDHIVGQIATAGMEAMKADIVAAVQKVLSPKAMIWKNDSGLSRAARTNARSRLPPGVAVGATRASHSSASGRSSPGASQS